MSETSAVVRSTVLFYGELWVGGVIGVGDVGIDEASDGKVGGVVSLSPTEIVIGIGFSG